jgi:glycosyltransferase involved in cell wall biosynthesis
MGIDRYPLVSIGMPIYNEERFVAQSLDSLLAQDYDNFELIISDNASSDGTSAICERYAARDVRIRYFRNHKNIGMIANFNRVFQLSHGDYFMWASGHDLWDKSFISTCLRELLDDPRAVLCAGQFVVISEEGTPGPVRHALNTSGMEPAERLRCVIGEHGSCLSVYGLIRADALRRTRVFNECYGSDWLLVAELSLLGEFRYAPHAIMYLRDTVRRKLGLTAEESAVRLLGPSSTKMNGRIFIYFPWLQFTLRMSNIIFRADIPFTTKCRLAIGVFSRLKWKVVAELGVLFLPRPLRRFLRQTLTSRFPGVYETLRGR